MAGGLQAPGLVHDPSKGPLQIPGVQPPDPRKNLMQRLLGGFQGAMGPGGPLSTPQDVTGVSRLTANPMLQMGLGILSAQRDPRQNAFQGALTGLQGAATARDQFMNQQMKEQEQQYTMQRREALQGIGTRVKGILDDPEQMKEMPAWLRQSAAELAEVDPEKAISLVNQWRDRQQSMTPRYHPRDWTVESWSEFMASGGPQGGDPSLLKRYQPYKIQMVNGVPTLVSVDPTETDPDKVAKPLSTLETEAEADRTLAFAQAMGTAQAGQMIDAAATSGDMKLLDNQLQMLMNDSDFDAAVGPVDRWTGALGEMAGTRQGVIGGHIGRISNALTTSKVADWKGAISDKELAFFKESVPQRSSSPETWRSWYQNEFLPWKAHVDAKASGQRMGITWMDIKSGSASPEAAAGEGAAQGEDNPLGLEF